MCLPLSDWPVVNKHCLSRTFADAYPQGVMIWFFLCLVSCTISEMGALQLAQHSVGSSDTAAAVVDKSATTSLQLGACHSFI